MDVLIFTQLNEKAAEIIKSGGVGIVLTDTLYGIVARADNHMAVERVFKIKQRTPSKSPIVLIASVDQLYDSYSPTVHNYLSRQWPGPVTVILPSTCNYTWLTRGNKSVAYRLPANNQLQKFIQLSSPIIAPSANPEGLPPASTIDEAVAYFGDQVDFYIDGGKVDPDAPPSQLWRYIETSDSAERLR